MVWHNNSLDPGAVFAVRGNSAAIRVLNPNGCAQAQVNSLLQRRRNVNFFARKNTDRQITTWIPTFGG
jgi:hypothetical protein